MKTALIFVRPRALRFDGEYYQNIITAFNNAGFDVDTIEMLSQTDDIAFKRRFDEFRDLADNIVIIGGDSAQFDVKAIIAEQMDTVLVENENAKTFLQAVCKDNGAEYPDSYATLPMEASVIPNLHGGFQGFILDSNQLTLAVLPNEQKEVKPMLEKYVLPYFENKLGIKRKRLVLKYFGQPSQIENTLNEAQNIGIDSLNYSITDNNGDVTVDILFNANTQDDVRAEIIRYVVSNHKEEIYAEFESSLGERLFDILKLKKLKLAVAESFTGGRVVSSVISTPGASEVVDEGVVTYSNQSKVKRLGVNPKDIETHGAVSSVVAYQMAVGLIKNGADVAIATTGIAGPASDDTKKPVGLCYIAVGTREGVHTYRYNFSGSREKITEMAKNTALFLAIKKLKNI